MGRRPRTPADPVAVARDVARAEVARRWPELAGVEPTVAPRARAVPSAAELERAGVIGLAPAASASAEYTFTFTGHTHTPEGYTMPRIARITIDSQRRVVKATTSK